MQNLSDRALKERIIGAVVLVVFVVLVVPVFLDGGSSEPEIVTETVTLPGQNNQERKQQTIVLERDRSEPVPMSRTADETRRAPPTGTDGAVATEPAPAEPDPPPPVTGSTTTPAPATSPAAASAAPASATGMWAVQLGSFSNQANAERLAADLRDQGYAAFLSRVDTGSGELHRVRVGPQKDRDGAEAVAKKLGAAGHRGQVVPHP